MKSLIIVNVANIMSFLISPSVSLYHIGIAAGAFALFALQIFFDEI